MLDPERFAQLLEEGQFYARCLRSYGLFKRAKRVHECSSLFGISCGQIETIGRKCRDRFCPGCSRARIFKYSERLQQLREEKGAAFVTFTWRDPLMPDIYAADHLRRRQRLFRMSCGPQAAGVWKWEFTARKSGGLHAHLHTVLAKTTPQEIRDSFTRPGIRDFDWEPWDGRHYELAKYFCKPMDFDAVTQLIEALSTDRIRLTDSFGLRRPYVKKPDKQFIADFEPRVAPPVQTFRYHPGAEIERLT